MYLFGTTLLQHLLQSKPKTTVNFKVGVPEGQNRIFKPLELILRTYLFDPLEEVCAIIGGVSVSIGGKEKDDDSLVGKKILIVVVSDVCDGSDELLSLKDGLKFLSSPLGRSSGRTIDDFDDSPGLVGIYILVRCTKVSSSSPQKRQSPVCHSPILC